jgi:Ca-activated chloride channel family protein
MIARCDAFYGEEYSENPEEVDPQHLAPSDAMIFQQVLRACDAQVIDPSDAVTIHASWESPITYVPMETTLTITLGEMLGADASQLEKGRAIVAYAEALRSGEAADLAEALAMVEGANPSQSDPDLSEIANLIVKHPAY